MRLSTGQGFYFLNNNNFYFSSSGDLVWPVVLRQKDSFGGLFCFYMSPKAEFFLLNFAIIFGQKIENNGPAITPSSS